MNSPSLSITILTLASTLCGCATSSPSVEPPQAALERTVAQTNKAVEEAAKEADNRDTYTVAIRHNPC
ncbi:MAG: hypothetical protein ACOCV2_03185, partial [Persicimonas sp.]